MPADRETLPVEAVIGEVLAALEQSGAAVLIAPPGAGKTTRVPLALLEQAAWCTGRVLVLEPRRLAARAAAARMADTLGEAVGERVGYRVRMDARVSARTRIEVVTEGVFTRMILDDPALEGVSAVLFDEFHERSLDADLGLAFAWESRALLREDLRVLVMSATLDGGRVSAALGGVPVIVSEGRVWPVETRYPGPPGDLRLEDAMSRAILTALSEEEGSVLAFLPGQGEIERTAGRADRAALWRHGPPRSGPRPVACAAGPAQGRAGYRHRRDQPDHRGGAYRGGQRPVSHQSF
jgi:ATP-dependent helicase HrpB